MEDKKRLYRVKDGALISTEIVKETPKLYWINDTKFSYGSNFYKTYACVTPEEALQEELNKALQNFGMRKDHMTRAFRRLTDIRRLKHSFESK